MGLNRENSISNNKTIQVGSQTTDIKTSFFFSNRLKVLQSQALRVPMYSGRIESDGGTVNKSRNNAQL